MLYTVLSLIATAAAIGSVICFIILVIKMFQAGDPMMGIVSLVLCLCGLGFLFALIIGWVNVDKYKARQLMPIYTAAFILMVVLGGISYANMPAVEVQQAPENVRYYIAA